MKLFSTGVFLSAVAFFFSPLAMGQVAFTNTGPDDNFDNGANWTNEIGTGVVPGPGDATFVFPGFITFASTDNSQITVEAGGKTTITINAPGNERVEAFFVSSNFDDLVDVVNTTVPNGILNLNEAGGSTFTIGAGGETVTGTSILNFTGNQTVIGNVVVGSDLIILNPNGITGAGTFNLTGQLNMDVGADNSLIIGNGGTGNFTENSGSTVITGPSLVIGEGATGTYNINTGATLDIGHQVNPGSTDYFVSIGGQGILNLAGTARLNAMNPDTFFEVAGIDNSVGTVNQNDLSVVNLGGFEFSIGANGVGTYNLISGTLNVSSTIFVIGEDGNGELDQTAGTLTATTGLVIGDGITNHLGSGVYNINGGIANIGGGIVIGFNEAANLNLRGGILTSTGLVTVGLAGQFDIFGGTANLNAGLLDGGAVTQLGGLVSVPAGQAIDLTTVGAFYTLAGGTLQVAGGGLIGTNGEGKLNFEGGTLQITSAGAFVDPIDSTLLGTSVIDAATTTGVTAVTLSGDISGAGGLNLRGTAGTTFNLTGADTFTGAINLPLGTLNIASGSIAATSAVNIGNTAMVNLTVATGGLAYAGAVMGAGTLNVDFLTAGNALVLRNVTGLTGSIALGTGGTAGTLQLFNGKLTSISGAGDNVTIGGAALTAFPVGVTAPTSGSVVLQGATYTGLTTVNTNFALTTDGLGGALTNNGLVGALSTSAVGTAVPVGGALTQSSTGILQIRTNGVAADSFTATTANLDGKIFISGTAATTPATFTIVSTTGGITTGALNNPAGLSTLSSFLLSTTLVLNGNDLQVTVQQLPIIGQTPNQIAVANVLNAMPLNPIFGTINNNLSLTGADAPSILEQLTPETVQYARIIAFENTNMLAIRTDNVAQDLRAGYGGLDTNAISVAQPGFNSNLGRSMHSFFASNTGDYHTAAPNGVNYYPGGAPGSPATSAQPAEEVPTFEPSNQVISDSPNPYLATSNPSGPETPKTSEFIGGDVVLADLNQDRSAVNAPSAKASYTAGDAVVGGSYRISQHLAAGVLFDYNHTDAKTDDSGSKIKVDTYMPGIFGTWYDHGFYVNGLASFGYNTYANKRGIPFLGETATSNPNGQEYVANIDGGYDFHPTRNLVVGPAAGLTYTHLDIDGYTETGSPEADLSVDDQSVDSLRSRFGAHVVYQTNTGDVLLQPNLSIMWQHEFLNDSDAITSRFASFSAGSFDTRTVEPSRDSALISLGLTATLSSSMALYLNYIADVGSDQYWAQSVVGGFKARF